MSKEKDRKLVRILLVIGAVVLVLFSFVYAQVKANQAEKNQMEALRQAELAEAETQRAEILKEKAEESAAEARMVQAEAERVQQLLTECQSK